ncbi:heptosyltransferase-2 [Pedobacter cryoconitis]|uniref:glycosyltransferase family 9 protein n=1 Tax=Pedobacter cryoconitis TaxID=188932 RepID=UPI00179C968A|nr:glycosyltransferase family 9 protein [Pedobacter cryoconitis]MBB6269839.1 heptosyltransferase-2 [Pedobacter cryoconitis]
MKIPKKILVIRFSSMGDIIYTTPVIRCLKLQIPGCEVHFLTKEQFKYIYQQNPYLTKLHFLKPTLSETIKDIKAEKFDLIIDLHNNLRTTLIKLATRIPSSTYKKDTISKWLALKFRWTRLFSKEHLVDRYLETVKFLGVQNDNKPIDYYVAKEYQLADLLPPSHQNKFIAFVIGATHFTKRLPNHQIIEICKGVNLPVVLLGGNDVKANAEEIKLALGDKVYSTCGITNLDQSVFLVSQAHKVIGFDTGLTHIAEAFDKPIASIWGGTTPELLGVYPYKIKDSLIAGIDLSCRPCSKFGLENCPLGHFDCMEKLPAGIIVNFSNE